MTAKHGQTNRTAAEAVFDHTMSPESPVYAVIDAAREPSVRCVAQETGAPCESLFAGALGEKLGHVAPHLVSFRARSPFRQWWFDQWGKSIGILAEAPVSLSELRRHFRTLLMVNGQGRKRYYFRFYDPRVLRAFLPACTPEELDRFVGPIKAFYCESANGEELLAFKFTEDE